MTGFERQKLQKILGHQSVQSRRRDRDRLRMSAVYVPPSMGGAQVGDEIVTGFECQEAWAWAPAGAQSVGDEIVTGFERQSPGSPGLPAIRGVASTDRRTDVRMRQIDHAVSLKDRMVLVRPDRTTFDQRSAQPIVHDGMWSGTVISLEPIKKGDDVVDYTLKIRVSFGTARVDRSMTVLFSSDRWKLRFPQKGEET